MLCASTTILAVPTQGFAGDNAYDLTQELKDAMEDTRDSYCPHCFKLCLGPNPANFLSEALSMGVVRTLPSWRLTL